MHKIEIHTSSNQTIFESDDKQTNGWNATELLPDTEYTVRITAIHPRKKISVTETVISTLSQGITLITVLSM